MGSFESWSQVIGGVLEAGGFEGFLDNREELYARVDPESLEWHALAEWWWEAFGDDPVAVSDLFPLVQRHEALPSLFATSRADAGERSLKTKLGTALKGHADRVYEGRAIRLVGIDTRTKAQLFRLVPTEPPTYESGGSAGFRPIIGQLQIQMQNLRNHRNLSSNPTHERMRIGAGMKIFRRSTFLRFRRFRTFRRQTQFRRRKPRNLVRSSMLRFRRFPTLPSPVICP